MMPIKYTLIRALSVITFYLISLGSFAQITSGNNEAPEKKEKEEKTKVKLDRDSLSGTNYYVTGMSMWSYRSFEDLTPFKSLSERDNETPGFGHGISAGVVLPLSDHFALDLGASYWGHSENYTFSDSLSDSTYSYKRRYLQLGVPIRIRATYGETLQGFVFAGVTPLNILQIRYDAEYRDSFGERSDLDEVTIKNDFASFNLMAGVGAGINYNLKIIGFTLSLEYRRHLLNSYDTNEIRVDHRMYGVALNYGMYLRF